MPREDDFSTQQKAKKLSPEELEKTSERLYSHSLKQRMKRQEEYNRDVEYQESHNRQNKRYATELSEKEAAAVEHLYTNPIQRKQKTQEGLEKKFAPVAANQKQVLPEEQDAITDRLYNQSMERKKRTMLDSEKRVYGKPQAGKKVDKDQIATSLDSLYTKAIEKKKEADSNLEAKYGWKNNSVGKKKLTKADADALGQRLATKSGN